MIVNADLREVLTLTRPLVCFDVETHDKCPPDRAYIVEIGMVIFYPDRDTKRWESFIRPPVGVKIHPCATAVHSITQEQVFEKEPGGAFKWPEWKNVAFNIAHGFSDCDFAGYNVGFDLRCVRTEMQRCRVPWSYEGAHIFDPLALWRKIATRTLSDAVREYAGREPTDAHRALADIQDTIDAGVGMHKRFGLPPTVKECHDLCKDNESIDVDGKFKWKGDTAIISFGKWSGTSLQDPALREYLKWMLRDDFSPDTKRVAQAVLDGKMPVKVKE